MRHHNANRKFGRKKDQRAALLKSLARELFLHGKIVTTEAKAKEVRPFAEELITIARVGDLASKRLVMSRLSNNAITKKLTDKIAPQYKERKGGYTRITKLPARVTDSAKMAAIELV